MEIQIDGASPRRYADRQYSAGEYQLPPRITRNEPYTLGWEMKLGARFLLYAERVQVLTVVDENRTHYMTEDRFSGWLRSPVVGLFGKAMERGFRDCGLGLKKAAESQPAEPKERMES